MASPRRLRGMPQGSPSLGDGCADTPAVIPQLLRSLVPCSPLVATAARTIMRPARGTSAAGRAAAPSHGDGCDDRFAARPRLLRSPPQGSPSPGRGCEDSPAAEPPSTTVPRSAPRSPRSGRGSRHLVPHRCSRRTPGAPGPIPKGGPVAGYGCEGSLAVGPPFLRGTVQGAPKAAPLFATAARTMTWPARGSSAADRKAAPALATAARTNSR